MSEKRQPQEPPADASEHQQKKQASSVVEINHDSPKPAEAAENGKFGTRTLSSGRDVFEHNAWDNVEPDSDHEKYAEGQIQLHKSHPVPESERERYNTNPEQFWNDFYQNNTNKFFKDRHWLRLEFPELFTWTDKRVSFEEAAEGGATECAQTGTAVEGSGEDVSVEKFRIMEVGCGAGNAVFPLLADVHDPRLFVYACDYSSTAVGVVKANEAYNEDRCKSFVWDLASPELPADVKPGSVDVMLMIFVFSALHPSQWKQAVANAYKLLKPNGLLLFRDYGRHDLAQLRFKKSRLLEENLYIRGDGTRVYFFTNDELAEIFGEKFVVEQNAIDRRLIVNRKRELKMYRVWMQCKFRKAE